MATEVKTRSDLDKALANENQVVLLVVGDGKDFEGIVGYADGAVLFPEIQAVVWVRDPDLLSADERAAYRLGDQQYVACALSRPQRQVCALVSRKSALTVSFMQAIDAAQKTRQPPAIFQ